MTQNKFQLIFDNKLEITHKQTLNIAELKFLR